MTLTTKNEQQIPGFFVSVMWDTEGRWWPAPGVLSESNKWGFYRADPCFLELGNSSSNLNHISLPNTISARRRLVLRSNFRYKHETIKRSRNWQHMDLGRPWTMVFFFVITFAYGGFHCLAWNSSFPSFIQQLLWRITSVGVASTGLVLLVCNRLSGIYIFRGSDNLHGAFGGISIRTIGWRILAFTALKPIFGTWTRNILFRVPQDDVLSPFIGDQQLSDGESGHSDLGVFRWTRVKRLGIGGIYWFGKSMDFLILMTSNLSWLFYAFARIYLVVECFIQLFHLPPGPVFEQAPWAVYFPHFG